MTPRKPQLVYAAAAIDDLVRLRAFIAEHDPSAAARVGADLAQRMQVLCAAPRMGTPVAAAPDPELMGDMVFGNYIVRYALGARAIAVLRVWHFEQRY